MTHMSCFINNCHKLDHNNNEHDNDNEYENEDEDEGEGDEGWEMSPRYDRRTSLPPWHVIVSNGLKMAPSNTSQAVKTTIAAAGGGGGAWDWDWG